MELVWFLKYINNEIVWCGVEIELAWRGNRQQLILATARVHGEQSKWSTYVCTHTQFTAEKAIVREVRGDEYRESESEGTRHERSQREPVVAADPAGHRVRRTFVRQIKPKRIRVTCIELASACMCAALHDDLI